MADWYGWTPKEIGELTIPQAFIYARTNEKEESRHFPGRHVKKFASLLDAQKYLKEKNGLSTD